MREGKNTDRQFFHVRRNCLFLGGAPGRRLLRLRRQLSGVWQTCIVLQNTSFGSISVDRKKRSPQNTQGY